MHYWSFDDLQGENEIEIGTIVCMGDNSPWGAMATVTRKASIKEIKAEGYEIEDIEGNDDEILYWIEYVNKNYQCEYSWRSNLYPALLEDSLV